jgi:hypothetical protein
VAASADGDTAWVGASNDGAGLGAVWVFSRDAQGTWTQSEKIVPPTSGFQFFGSSLAVASSTSTLIVGAPGVNTVYTYDGSQAPEVVSISDAEQFGTSVAIDSAGTVAVVGAPVAANGVGGVYVLTRPAVGSSWTTLGPFSGTGRVGNSHQGGSVAASGDGNTVLVGGTGNDQGVGAFWTFTRSADTKEWVPMGEAVVPSDHKGASSVGSAVAISGDGQTALVGGSNDNGANGAAWVFTRSGSVWKQQQTLRNNLAAAAEGATVALTPDAKAALVGAPDADSKGVASVGTVLWFQRAPVACATITGRSFFADNTGSLTLSCQSQEACRGHGNPSLDQLAEELFCKANRSTRGICSAGTCRTGFCVPAKLSTRPFTLELSACQWKPDPKCHSGQGSCTCNWEIVRGSVGCGCRCPTADETSFEDDGCS